MLPRAPEGFLAPLGMTARGIGRHLLARMGWPGAAWPSLSRAFSSGTPMRTLRIGLILTAIVAALRRAPEGFLAPLGMTPRRFGGRTAKVLSNLGRPSWQKPCRA